MQQISAMRFQIINRLTKCLVNATCSGTNVRTATASMCPDLYMLHDTFNADLRAVPDAKRLETGLLK